MSPSLHRIKELNGYCLILSALSPTKETAILALLRAHAKSQCLTSMKLYKKQDTQITQISYSNSHRLVCLTSLMKDLMLLLRALIYCNMFCATFSEFIRTTCQLMLRLRKYFYSCCLSPAEKKYRMALSEAAFLWR